MIVGNLFMGDTVSCLAVNISSFKFKFKKKEKKKDTVLVPFHNISYIETFIHSSDYIYKNTPNSVGGRRWWNNDGTTKATILQIQQLLNKKRKGNFFVNIFILILVNYF